MVKALFNKTVNQTVFKPLLYSALSLAGVALVLGFVGQSIAQRQQSTLDAIADDFFQRYPNQSKNEAAHELERLASKLGLGSLSGFDSAAAEQPDPVQVRALEVVQSDLDTYLTNQLQKSQGELEALPADLKRYLDENRYVLIQVQTHLRGGQRPLWEVEVAEMADFSYALPSFSGLLKLQKLLLAKAVSDQQQDNLPEMVAALEASLVINEALAQRPDLLSYLVGVMAANHNAGMMRHLSGVPPRLSRRLLDLNQPKRAVERLQFENWITYKSMQTLLDSRKGLGQTFEGSAIALIDWVPFRRTYFQLSYTDIARTLAEAHRQLLEKSLCASSAEEIEAELGIRAPWWNVLGQVAMPSFVRQWQKGGESQLAAELTHHIVTAKAVADEQGQWPKTLPQADSTTCPGQTWVYQVSPTGKLSLAFSHSPAWLQPDAGTQPRLPLSYTVSLPE